MPLLFLVPHQMPLFFMGALPAVVNFAEPRSGEDIVRSARSYLRSQAKDYADAAALLNCHLLNPDVWNTPEQIARDRAAQLELDIMRGAPPPLSPPEIALSGKNRAQLGDELMHDPLYTDRRLIAHLGKRKLARMLMQSRERRAAAGARSASDRRCA